MTLLNRNNVDMTGENFWRHYNNATSVFNGFFGILSMCANNAFNEALDVYEDTPDFRHRTKKLFKDTKAAWDRFWRVLGSLFEDKYAVYIDFVSLAAGDMEDDVSMLSMAVCQSLLKCGVEDAGRRAWLFTADLLIHELQASYKRYLIDIVRESRLPKLAEAFRWADPTHLVTLTHSLVRHLCPVHVGMSDDVVLALRIIGQHAFSADRQDGAAVRALQFDSNEEHREAMAESIAAYEQHVIEKRQEEQQANEAYERKRQEDQRRRRHNRREPLTADIIAEKLGQHFKVNRI